MLTPWDLDCSLGGNWDGTYYNYPATNQEILPTRIFPVYGTTTLLIIVTV